MRVLQYQLNHGHIAYQWSHEPRHQPLIVLHGLGDSAIHTYAPRFARSVLRDTPALFIDFPGFGEAFAGPHYPATIEQMATDVAALIRSLEIQDAPVFAHSMGANVAIILAHRYPNLISKAILAEPLLDRDQSVLAAGIAKHSEETFIARGYTMLLRATSLQARRGDVAAQVFLPTLKMANPTTLHRAADSLLQPRDPGFICLFHGLKQPTSLLVGGKSGINFAGVGPKQTHVTYVPDAGHFMMAEESDATACAILSLVN